MSKILRHVTLMAHWLEVHAQIHRASDSRRVGIDEGSVTFRRSIHCP